MRPVAAAIAQTLEKTITSLSRELIGLKRDIQADRGKVTKEVDDVLCYTSDVLEQRRRQIEGLQTRSWIPLLAIGALALVVTTAILAPWALTKANGGLLCWAADGTWYQSSGSCISL